MYVAILLWCYTHFMTKKKKKETVNTFSVIVDTASLSAMWLLAYS